MMGDLFSVEENARFRAAQELPEGTLVSITGMDGPVFIAHKREATFIGLYDMKDSIATKLFTWGSLGIKSGLDSSGRPRVQIWPTKEPESVKLLEMVGKCGYDTTPQKPKLGTVYCEDIKFCKKGMMIKIDEGKFVLVDMILREMKKLGKDMFQHAKHLRVKRTEDITAEEAVQKLVGKNDPKEKATNAIEKLIASRKRT